ncbi:hypothetical protein [Parafrigoribacterium soli]|uniref:hypothetical protein n=1 Tax=Parafrigoribacterium soli TaxID=3144663 RepID=UPI0032EE5A44
MYAALWRILPGPVWLRILQLILLLAVVLFLLVAFVFPWFNEWINVSEVTVNT